LVGSKLSHPPPHLIHVSTSGGLFTEESLVRLRDTFDRDNNLPISGYHEAGLGQLTRTQFEEKVAYFWEFATETWDGLAPKVDQLDISRLRGSWAIPFFRYLGFDPSFQRGNEVIEGPSEQQSTSIYLSHRGWFSADAPRIHIVLPREGFDVHAPSDRNANSPHDAMQRFLVLSKDVDWGILFNGRSIRLLTKYYHEYTRGYVEFDLENILEDRDFDEFRLLYRLLHVSCFRKDSLGRRPIDGFYESSKLKGVKIGDELRDNVKKSLELLADDLLKRDELKRLESDTTLAEEFFTQLLRVFYRILFILYAEQRGMLPGQGTLYGREYSITRLRELSERTPEPDDQIDLWRGLQTTFSLVQRGSETLGVVAYNGDLFDPEKTSILNKLSCRNETLLNIVRNLTTVERDGVKSRISYIDIDVEEIGSIYESLLDYRPTVLTEPRAVENELYSAHKFILLPRGLQRKTTGSYYTHKGLVNVLIKTTLAPVVKQRLSEARKKLSEGDRTREVEALRAAILNIKVCDPACGGGTFLIAALDYLGLSLSQIESGREQPSEDELREARRTVLMHCIYGVDRNPLAVELAKISLWLHAFVKDKPLNFLDHRIKCGDSLIGATTDAIRGGIIPEAFTALKGEPETGVPHEDAKLAKELTRITAEVKRKPRGASSLTSFTGDSAYQGYAKEVQSLESLSEDNPQAVATKAEAYRRILLKGPYEAQKLVYDTWVSSFFWPLTGELSTIGGKERLTPTEVGFREVVEGRGQAKLLAGVADLSKRYRFFQWSLEFPEVFEREAKGFDCILTNPPWEVMTLEEEEFFAGRKIEIEEEKSQTARRTRIKTLTSGDERDKALHREYVDSWFAYKKTSAFMSSSGLYKLSAQGIINSYQLFVERCWRLIGPKGRAGLVVPTGLITNYYTQELFAKLIEEKSLISLFDFENRNEIFPIHRSFRFSLLTIGGGDDAITEIPMAFYLLDPKETEEMLEFLPENNSEVSMTLNKLPLEAKLFAFTKEDFEILNPNTLTCPIFKTRRDAEITKYLYRQSSILIRKERSTGRVVSNPWKVSFKQGLFNMSSDSRFFKSYDQLLELGARLEDADNPGGPWRTNRERFLPLYEGKMIWYYDHRYNSVIETSGLQGTGEGTTIEQHNNPRFSPIPRYYVSENETEEKIPKGYTPKCFIGFRNITNATNERTFVVSLLPRVPVGHSMPLFFFSDRSGDGFLFIANLSSIIFDYIARIKIGPSINMTFFYVEQFPIIEYKQYSETIKEMIRTRVLELVYTSYDIKGFAADLSYSGEPFGWDENRRAVLMAELDAIYAHLYKVSKDDLTYILAQFPVLKKNDERQYGEYRTRRLVLEAYDRIKPQMEETS
jgi:hypothetical protein